MNKNNYKVWHDPEKGILHGEWSDRALDDDDRYTPSSHILRVQTPCKVRDSITEKTLLTLMVNRYDVWYKLTRNGN